MFSRGGFGFGAFAMDEGVILFIVSGESFSDDFDFVLSSPERMVFNTQPATRAIPILFS